MMTKRKSINLICIFLVMAVIMSSALMAAITIFDDGTNEDDNSSKKHFGGYNPLGGNNSWGDMDISLDDLSGLLNLNGMLGLMNNVPQNLNTLVYKVRSTETEQLYLRIKSFGNYNGSNMWNDAWEYSIDKGSAYSPIYLTGDTLSYLQRASVQIEAFVDQYLLAALSGFLLNKSGPPA